MEKLIENSLKNAPDKIMVFKISRYKTLNYLFKIFKIKDKIRGAKPFNNHEKLQTGHSFFTTFHVSEKGDYKC